MFSSRIIYVLFFLSHAAFSKPWYEYSKNHEAKKFVETYLKPIASDRESLADKGFLYASYVANVILPMEKRKEPAIKLIDKLIYLLIKAMDLGSVEAKFSLSIIIREGLYGVDIDENFANTLQRSLDSDEPYLDPKPWYSFNGSNDDHQFVMKELLKGKKTAAKNILKKSKSYLSNLIQSPDIESSKIFLDSFMFLLVKASELGHEEAQDALGNILRNGISGIKRNVEFANILKTELAISRLTGFEAVAALEFESYVVDFEFDPISSVLSVLYDKANYYYYSDEAKNLFQIFSYLKNKHEIIKSADDALLKIKQIFNDLDKVD